MSNMFLETPIPKLLILGTHFALDGPLTVGQMQGKYALKLLPGAGHAIHEDQPNMVANELMAFYRRWSILQSKIQKKIFPYPGAPLGVGSVSGGGDSENGVCVCVCVYVCVDVCGYVGVCVDVG